MTKLLPKDLKRLFQENEEFKYTNILGATYYVDSNGNGISFGYEERCRTDDHRVIFSFFEDIERNDWKEIFKRTGLLMIIPECNEAFTLKGVRLTNSQKQFISDNRLDLTRE